LLYGSKVLTPWLWFGSDEYYTGIVNANESGFVTTDKYYVIKNTLTPRLSGLMGKTLKRLKPLSQFVADNAMKYPYNIPKNYINKLILTTYTQSIPPIFDIGFYYEPNEEPTGDEKRYFMLIDRYYPNRSYDKIKIEFKNLFRCRNWKFINFCDSTSYYIISDINGTGLTNEITITKGDGYLLGLHPVVRYGGDLIANDTIKTNTELIEDMWIKNNVNLIIERGKYYTIKDTVTLEGTGFITGKGYLNISQGGDIKINSWNKSVFKGREGNHPKIYWGKFPNSANVTSYKIYRRKGETNFTHIGTVSPNNPRYFIDNTVTILDRPEPFATFAEYKVTATYQNGNPIVESDFSNTIRYDEVDGIAVDKMTANNSEVITEYKLFQNYPNPFNPATMISWQSPVSSHQTLKIYDILGNEVTTLVDEYREAGRYTLNFDASRLSSGVYIYRITAGEFTDVKKMALVK
jgi:hypothetical protein